jgi:hypothetical protein
MVEDAARGIGEMSVLVSADSDLIPAIESTRRLDATRPIYVAMPPSRARGASRFQGVGIFGVSKPALRAAQMPNVVTDPATGRSYLRPAKWA